MPTFGAHGKLAESWWGTNTPTTGPVGTASTWVGVTLEFSVPGRIFGLRAYEELSTSAVQYGILAGATDTVIRCAPFPQPNAGANGWVQTWFRPTFRVTVGTTYKIGVLFINAHYFRNNTALVAPVTRNGISFVSSFQSTAINWFLTVPSSNSNANAVDVLFQAD